MNADLDLKTTVKECCDDEASTWETTLTEDVDFVDEDSLRGSVTRFFLSLDYGQEQPLKIKGMVDKHDKVFGNASDPSIPCSRVIIASDGNRPRDSNSVMVEAAVSPTLRTNDGRWTLSSSAGSCASTLRHIPPSWALVRARVCSKSGTSAPCSAMARPSPWGFRGEM